MSRLDDMRAALVAKNDKTKKVTTSGDTANYPFWNLPNGAESWVRLFPDLDEDNMFFWREQQIIKLPFNGQVGGQYATNRPVEVTVPCIKQWGMQCPILADISPLWDAGDGPRAIARTYNRQRLFKYQGTVVTPGFKEENAPENPIRRFTFKIKLHTVIETSLMNPQLRTNPIDFEGGRDFAIRKTQSGQWPDYSTSNWSFDPRSLDENERIALSQFGLWDLSKFVGECPDAEGIAMITQMYRDSRAGLPFDTASYGEKFRAYNKRGNDEGENVAETVQSRTPAPQTPTQVVVPPAYVPTPVAAVVPQTIEQPVAQDVVETVTPSIPQSQPPAAVAPEQPAASTQTQAPRTTDPKQLLAELRAKSRAAAGA